MSMASTTNKLTRNQSLVQGALTETKAPMTAYQILDVLRIDGLNAPLQVYRALDKLVDFGLVHRLESMNAFVACQQHDCHDTRRVAFAICDECGHVRKFPVASVSKHLERWAKSEDFELVSTVLELPGRCAGCVKPDS